MKTIELQPGIHKLPMLTEPTRIVSVQRWRAILEPAGDSADAVAVAARQCRIEGCQIRNGSGDKGDRRIGSVGAGVRTLKGCKQLRMEDCWVHGNAGHGIYSGSDVALRVHRCLIERNGTQNQLDHGIYAAGWFHVTNSLLLENASFQLHAYPENSVGLIYRTVCYGSLRDRTIIHGGPIGRLAVIQCTLFGQRPKHTDGTEIELDSSTLMYPDSFSDQAAVDLAHPGYHLFFLRRAEVRAGAYDYDPALTSREQAAELWRGGFMGGWGENSYAGNGSIAHKYPFPIFPSDPVPAV